MLTTGNCPISANAEKPALTVDDEDTLALSAFLFRVGAWRIVDGRAIDRGLFSCRGRHQFKPLASRQGFECIDEFGRGASESIWTISRRVGDPGPVPKRHQGPRARRFVP
jgi:hypothetical protein